MIRFLIAGVMVLMASNANATTNELLYAHCKPFSERAFEVRSSEDILCLSYFSGAIDYSTNFCAVTGKSAKTDASIAASRSYFGAALDAYSHYKAIIQFYVNYMQLHPEEWKNIPSGTEREAIKSIAPCE